MTHDSPVDAFTAIARRLSPGATLSRHWRLTGGVSAAVHALEMRAATGEVRRVVVRRHGAAAWKPLVEDVAAVEFRLLTSLHHAGLPVPEPLLLDTSCQLLSSPFLVMAMVEGSPHLEQEDLPAAIPELAGFLARLHQLDSKTLGLPPLQRREDPVSGALETLPGHLRSKELCEAIRSQELTLDEVALLHGDYWPGNVMWSGARIAAVLDWEDAAIGSPASDLACCRAELNALHGPIAMQQFTDCYLGAHGLDASDLPLWDLYVGSAALASLYDWGLPPELEAQRRERTTAFVERAARELTLAAGRFSGCP